MEQRVLPSCDPQLELKRRIDRLEDAFGRLVPSGHDAAHPPALVRELLAGG